MNKFYFIPKSKQLVTSIKYVGGMSQEFTAGRHNETLKTSNSFGKPSLVDSPLRPLALGLVDKITSFFRLKIAGNGFNIFFSPQLLKD